MNFLTFVAALSSPGMEDGLFPGYMSIMSDDPEELEEERRLCYVAITRAMKHLTISYAKRRMEEGRLSTILFQDL